MLDLFNLFCPSVGRQIWNPNGGRRRIDFVMYRKEDSHIVSTVVNMKHKYVLFVYFKFLAGCYTLGFILQFSK